MAQNAPDEAQFLKSSEAFQRFAAAITKRAEEETRCWYSRDDWSADLLTSESESYIELAEAFRTFGAVEISGHKPLSNLADCAWHFFESEAENLVEAAAKKTHSGYEDQEPDDSEPAKDDAPPVVEDLQRIFDDL